MKMINKKFHISREWSNWHQHSKWRSLTFNFDPFLLILWRDSFERVITINTYTVLYISNTI